MTAKIVFVIPSLDPGGIETYLLRFLGFAKGQIQPHVVVRSLAHGELYEPYKGLAAEITFQPMGYVNPLNMMRYIRLFKALEPSVVVDFSGNFAGLTMLLSQLAGVERRVTFYRQGRDHFKRDIPKTVYNWCANRLVHRYATSIFSNSQTAVGFFFPYRTQADRRYRVIPNGVCVEDYDVLAPQGEIRESLGLPQGTFVIGHVGRLDPAKNHPMILQVAEHLLREGLQMHFVLCGQNTESLLPVLQAKGLSEHFTVLGFRPDVPRVLKALDLFFFPSWTEGQPNALIEAMVAGVKVIASDIPAIRECLPEDYHGSLIPPDDLVGFVGALRAANFSNDGTAVRLRDYARERFDGQKNFKLFLDQIS